MRHIPDDEIHAYLDQALSRSQCVEIECHLATCVLCRHERDQIAALRDRTTALLGLLTPAGRPRPSYAEMALRARGRQAVTGAPDQDADLDDARPQRAWSLPSLVVRAAGVLVAIAIGWSSRGFITSSSTPTATRIQQFASGPSLESFGLRPPLFSSLLPGPGDAQARTEQASPPPDPSWRPDPAERAAVRPEPTPAAPPSTTAPLAVTVSTADGGGDQSGDFAAGGVWRTVSWSEAAALTGDAVPRVVGLPVLEIQVQRVSAEERPLIMVAQQNRGGGIVRTIEGPAERLAELLAGEISRSNGAIQTSQPVRSAPDYVGAASGQPRRTIRVMTVAGRLDVESLNQLARTLTVR